MVDGRLNGRPLDSKPQRGHSSDGRAPALQAGGRRFDPGWLHQEVPAREQISRARSRPSTRRVPPLCSLCAARARGEGSARRLSIRWSQRADGVREAHSDRALPTFRANGVPTSRGSTGRSRRRVRARGAPWRTHPPVRREKGRRPPDASGSRSATARELSVASHRTRRRRYWLSAQSKSAGRKSALLGVVEHEAVALRRSGCRTQHQGDGRALLA